MHSPEESSHNGSKREGKGTEEEVQVFILSSFICRVGGSERLIKMKDIIYCTQKEIYGMPKLFRLMLLLIFQNEIYEEKRRKEIKRDKNR